MQVLTDQELNVIFDYLTIHNQVESIEKVFELTSKSTKKAEPAPQAVSGADTAAPALNQAEKALMRLPLSIARPEEHRVKARGAAVSAILGTQDPARRTRGPQERAARKDLHRVRMREGPRAGPRSRITGTDRIRSSSSRPVPVDNPLKRKRFLRSA
jgi:translation initiation factor IF-2